jgi:hypothetical protein
LGPKLTVTGTVFEPLLVPVRDTVWVLPAAPSALSVIVSVPVSVPVEGGVKVTLMVQLPAAATLDPQLLVWAKSLAPVVMAMLEMASATLLVLVRVTG